jgi:GNAT superfamily N-acetyltransferase
MNSPLEAELTLSGIHREVQRKGLYAALFWDALKHCQEIGATKAVTSTQINNYAVQKVWSRFGFVHERSYYTLHKWFD